VWTDSSRRSSSKSCAGCSARRVRRTTRSTLLILAACVVVWTLVCASGCGTRTIWLDDGDVLRLREPVAADVWVWVDGEGWRAARAELPEGWFVWRPDPGIAPEPKK